MVLAHRCFYCLLAAFFAGGCVTPARTPSQPPPLISNPRGVVFAVDGAGGFQATSTALRDAIDFEHMPLNLEVFEWSHGYGRVLADQMSWSHIQEAGQQL